MCLKCLSSVNIWALTTNFHNRHLSDVEITIWDIEPQTSQNRNNVRQPTLNVPIIFRTFTTHISPTRAHWLAQCFLRSKYEVFFATIHFHFLDKNHGSTVTEHARSPCVSTRACTFSWQTLWISKLFHGGCRVLKIQRLLHHLNAWHLKQSRWTFDLHAKSLPTCKTLACERLCKIQTPLPTLDHGLLPHHSPWSFLNPLCPQKNPSLLLWTSRMCAMVAHPLWHVCQLREHSWSFLPVRDTKVTLL